MPTTDTAQLKETIRQSFRKACLKRLEGHEADAVKILQEELPPKIKEWKLSDDCAPGEIEGLLAEELARTESAHWVVKETETRVKRNLEGVLTGAQAEAMQSIVAAKVQLELNALRDRIEASFSQILTTQGAEALNARSAQEMAERIRAVVGEAFTSHAQKNTIQLEAIKVAIKGALSETLTGSFDEILSKAQQGFSEELVSYENRENHRWAERQSSWGRMLEGNLKKSDLDAALWQAQNAIGERVEGKIRSLDGLSNDVKLLLEERLQKLVTAEAFEARLMAGATMISDALGKAFQESAAGLQATVERRLNETTGPIYQRLSGLLTFSDWERLTREINDKTVSKVNEDLADALELSSSKLQAVIGRQQNDANEKLAGQLSAELQALESKLNSEELTSAISANLNKFRENLDKVFADHTNTEAQRAQVLLAELQTIRAKMETAEKGGLQVTLLENLRAFSERLATMMIENTEQQKSLLKNMQKEFADQQTQSLGMMAVQQQNILGGIAHDWVGMKKTIEEIRSHQVVMEAEVNALQHRLESTLTDAVGKKLRTLKVVTE